MFQSFETMNTWSIFHETKGGYKFLSTETWPRKSSFLLLFAPPPNTHTLNWYGISLHRVFWDFVPNFSELEKKEGSMCFIILGWKFIKQQNPILYYHILCYTENQKHSLTSLTTVESIRVTFPWDLVYGKHGSKYFT